MNDAKQPRILKVLLAYAKDNPQWKDSNNVTQDPDGVHALLAELAAPAPPREMQDDTDTYERHMGILRSTPEAKPTRSLAGEAAQPQRRTLDELVEYVYEEGSIQSFPDRKGNIRDAIVEFMAVSTPPVAESRDAVVDVLFRERKLHSQDCDCLGERECQWDSVLSRLESELATLNNPAAALSPAQVAMPDSVEDLRPIAGEILRQMDAAGWINEHVKRDWEDMKTWLAERLAPGLVAVRVDEPSAQAVAGERNELSVYDDIIAINAEVPVRPPAAPEPVAEPEDQVVGTNDMMRKNGKLG